MSNTDENLHLTITADAGSGTTAVSDMEARLAALETQFNKTTASGVAQTGVMKDLETHYRLASTGLQVFGLEADAAGVKVAALTEFVEGLGKAAPGLLAVGAAIAVIGGSISFFKDGVKLAADFEGEMVSLGTAVKLAGGNWATTSKQVEEYADMMERATGFDAGQVVAGMNKLVTGGASVKDAEYEVSVAADLARAKHIDLADAINAVISAEAGRGMELARLDPRVKELIKDHSDLYTVLKQVEDDMSGQASSSTETFEGKVRALSGAWDEFKRDVGNWLLPWLKDVIDRFDDTVRGIDGMMKALGHGDIKGAWAAGTGHAGSSTAAAQRSRNGLMSNTNGLDFNPNMGNGGAGDGGYFPSITRAASDDSAYGFGKSDAATNMMKAFAQVEADLQSKVDGATSSIDRQAATMSLLNQKAEDARAEETALQSMIATDTAAKIAQNAATENSYKAYSNAVTALNAYKQSLAGSKESDDAKKREQDLQQTVDDLKAKWDGAKKTLGELNTTLTEHKTKLDEVGTAAQKAQDALVKAANAEALADADYYAKAAEDQSEFLATFNKTNAQKVAAYDRLISQLSSADADYDQHLRDLTTKRTQAWEASLDDQAKAYKKWVDDVTKQTESFLDDVLVKHETLRDELKSIYDQIAKNAIDSLTKMAMGNGTGFLGQLFGGGPAGAGGGANSPSYTGNALNVHVESAGTSFLTSTTGNTSGVGTSSITQQMNTLSPTSGGGAAATAGSGIGLGAIMPLLGAIAGGTAVGGGLSNMVTGGNSNAGNSAIGGAAGGIGGLLLGLGANAIFPGLSVAMMALLGGAGGGLLGGLFGPHETAAETPDSSSQSYNQNLADWQGAQINSPMGQFTPQNQFYTANGGVSQSAQISNMIDTTNLASLTTAQQGIVQQLIALNGGTSGNNLGITSENQGNVQFGSGATTSVTNWQNLLAQYQSLFGASSPGSPIYSVGRSYPDFNLGTLNNTGASTPATNAGTQVGNVTVIVNNPTLVGPAGLNGVAVQIGQAIYNAQQGNVIGSPATYRGIGPSVTNNVANNA